MTVKIEENYNMLERRRKALQRKISKVGPFLMGTPTYLMSKCGNPKCKCKIDKTARHEKLSLSWTDSEGSGTCYVPVDIHKEVFEWVNNYWKMKEYMKEMTALSRKMIRIYARTVGRVKKQQQKKVKGGKK